MFQILITICIHNSDNIVFAWRPSVYLTFKSKNAKLDI